MRVPKARSRSGSPEPFRSSVVPRWVRRCASLDAAIPWLYLHGVSTGQMCQAVAALVGNQAARGLSANVVSRLERSWDEEYRQWSRRRLDDERSHALSPFVRFKSASSLNSTPIWCPSRSDKAMFGVGSSPAVSCSL